MSREQVTHVIARFIATGLIEDRRKRPAKFFGWRCTAEDIDVNARREWCGPV